MGMTNICGIYGSLKLQRSARTARRSCIFRPKPICPSSKLERRGDIRGNKHMKNLHRVLLTIDSPLRVYNYMGEMRPTEPQFCRYCGAGIGKHRRAGEGTCPKCDP